VTTVHGEGSSHAVKGHKGWPCDRGLCELGEDINPPSSIKGQAKALAGPAVARCGPLVGLRLRPVKERRFERGCPNHPRRHVVALGYSRNVLPPSRGVFVTRLGSKQCPIKGMCKCRKKVVGEYINETLDLLDPPLHSQTSPQLLTFALGCHLGRGPAYSPLLEITFPTANYTDNWFQHVQVGYVF
jgi:hypothetical protein